MLKNGRARYTPAHEVEQWYRTVIIAHGYWVWVSVTNVLLPPPPHTRDPVTLYLCSAIARSNTHIHSYCDCFFVRGRSYGTYVTHL